jgi:SAM-dependent methyltransferase
LTHLGGYVAGPIGDAATFYPELWTWAVKELGVRSVLDIGCGEGHALRFFAAELGCFVEGVDGVPQENPFIREHDFTTGPYNIRRQFDLVWSCEAVEHIEERFLRNLVPSFQSGKYVFMTHAFPGQAGHHHVNCQPPDYWRGFFATIGYEYRPGLTNLCRELASANPSPWNHFVRSGMCFERLG